MMPADQVLLQRYKDGDARAFRDLVERYAPPVYRTALRLVGDPMEAENIAQETFLRVIKSVTRIQLEKPFKPYLFRIAINLCYDYGRKKRAVLFTDLDNGRTEADDPASELILDNEPQPWERAEKHALAREVSAAVDALPAPYKSAIVLRYAQEFTYEEIAIALDIPINTVRTHLRRGKNYLRVSLAEQSKWMRRV